MTTTLLSAPKLFFPAELKSNSTLTTQIIDLTNDAFARSKAPNPAKWSTRPRFERLQQYHDMLVDKCVVAVIFDKTAGQKFSPETEKEVPAKEKESEARSRGRVVACAAAVPWAGGWAKEGAGTEDGWEIKAISVDGSPQYLRQGLAIQVMDALENFLIQNAKKQWQEREHIERIGVGRANRVEQATLSLWILAAECINGAYWRRRGYHEVRRTTEGNGTWGCQTSFDLVVFRKDVSYYIAD
jgi:GNAT superfamily N-acetyltransferase